MLTHQYLRLFLTYDPDTGVWRWNLSQGMRKAGAVAGSWDANRYRKIGIGSKIYLSSRLAWFYMTGQAYKKASEKLHGNYRRQYD